MWLYFWYFLNCRLTLEYRTRSGSIMIIPQNKCEHPQRVQHFDHVPLVGDWYVQAVLVDHENVVADLFSFLTLKMVTDISTSDSAAARNKWPWPNTEHFTSCMNCSAHAQLPAQQKQPAVLRNRSLLFYSLTQNLQVWSSRCGVLLSAWEWSSRHPAAVSHQWGKRERKTNVCLQLYFTGEASSAVKVENLMGNNVTFKYIITSFLLLPPKISSFKSIKKSTVLYIIQSDLGADSWMLIPGNHISCLKMLKIVLL